MVRIRSTKKVTVVKVVLAVVGVFLFSLGWSNPGDAAIPLQMKFAMAIGPSSPGGAGSYQEFLKELSRRAMGRL